MELKEYIDLHASLQNDQTTEEEKRAFGLAHETLREKPFLLLKQWVERERKSMRKPLLSEKSERYFYGISLILGTIAFFLGLFSGIALLRYSGEAPVNVIYFMAMAIVLPLLTMTVALFSMGRAHTSSTFLRDLSPAFWMEKLINKLFQNQREVPLPPLPPSLLNWFIIQRSQLLALLFSVGLFLALLGVVATRDIAFSWSTTLHVTPEAFHTLLETIAFPWKTYVPSAVPTLELVEQSQYFRLGGSVDPQMVQHASRLGEWWKFLAFSTLFYAIFLRSFLWIVAKIGYKKALKRACLSLEGVVALLKRMNEPLITTVSPEVEKVFERVESHYTQERRDLEEVYDTTLGWAMAKERLLVLNDTLDISSPLLEKVGGANSLEEDSVIISQSKGSVLLYVKAWEPPTDEFMDFLHALAKVAEKITVVPAGMPQESDSVSESDIGIWDRKLQQFGEKKVWLKV